jgi:hypothetical protein
MPGHEDPKGIIKYDNEGKAYIEIIEEKQPLEELIEEIKVVKSKKKKE